MIYVDVRCDGYHHEYFDEEPPGEGSRASLVLGPWVSESPSDEDHLDNYHRDPNHHSFYDDDAQDCWPNPDDALFG